MHYLSNWFTKNPVAANLMMILILVAGYLSFNSIRIEGFPKIAPDSVTISVAYPGASPEQVDQSVSQKIEKSLEGLPGTKRTTSFSGDSYGFVNVQKEPGYNFDRFVEDIKTRVDAIYNLPQQAERPIITRDEFKFPALIVQVFGDVEQDVLQKVSRRVKSELLSQPEIAKLRQWGDRNYEISINLDPIQLQRYSLSQEHIAQKISEHSLLFRSGQLKTLGGNIRVRADKQGFHWQDFAEIPIVENLDGTRIQLQDIAHVKDAFENEDSQVRYQGQPSIGMEIIIDGKGNLLTVSDVAKATIARLKKELPQGIDIDIWANQSIYISDRLDLLQSNAIQGLILVFVLLAVFLNIKLAFWVAAGIPIAVAGTLAVMGIDNIAYSLNDITTFGMIIVLGILVDDAVVVGESVFNERSKVSDPIKGTQAGVAKVSTATVFGILTTIAAFYPMLLIDNALGKVLASFAGVVIIALVFSLLESKLILPAHLAQISINKSSEQNIVQRYWYKTQAFFTGCLDYVNHQLYKPLLAVLLKFRYATVIIFITSAAATIGMISNGKIKTVFFPDIPGSLITVTMEMDQRSPYALTLQNAQKIESAAQQINATLIKEFNLENPPIARIMTAITDTTTMELYAELLPENLRGTGTLDIVNRWREATGQLEGVELLNFSGSEATGGGFALRVSSPYQEDLIQGVEQISRALESLPGVFDIRDDLKGGVAEIFVRLKPEARNLGLNEELLARQIGNGYGGYEVQRIQRGSDEVKVMVRFDDNQRSSLNQLRQSRVQTANGQWVPLIVVADLESRYTPSVLWRRNAKRSAIISANLDKTKITPSEVFAWLEKETVAKIEYQFAGFELAPAGELEEEGEIRGGLVKALILTLILIYSLLAIPLKSYWQPFVIMSVIPFGFAGAAMGHLIMDIPLSILSFFGMLALAGIVVNDSLVMLTHYNQMRKEGMSQHQALVEAGSSRFRAIFLTTVTTVAGLMPLLSETSEQAQYLKPAAVSLAYGEIFATTITLILVPIMLSIFSDFRINKNKLSHAPNCSQSPL